MKLIYKIKLARAKRAIELTYNWGILYAMPRKYKKIALLIAFNLILWTSNYQNIPSNSRYIENVYASSVEIPEEKVAEDPVNKLNSSLETEEYLGGEATQIPEVEDIIRQYFPEEPEVMIAIAKSESGLNPKAGNKNRNGSIDTGLFQINSIHGYAEEWLKDPENNIKAARDVYDRQGKEAWVVYNTKNYLYNL